MPDRLVCVGVFTAVAVFSAVTFAPTTTAPLESVTWPVIAPVTVWPKADDMHIRTTVKQAKLNCNQDCILLLIWGLLRLLGEPNSIDFLMDCKCRSIQNRLSRRK